MKGIINWSIGKELSLLKNIQMLKWIISLLVPENWWLKLQTEKNRENYIDVIWTSESTWLLPNRKGTACSKPCFPWNKTISLILSLISMVLLPQSARHTSTAYNTRFVKDNPPAEWADILKPEYERSAFGIANPELSVLRHIWVVSLLKINLVGNSFEKLKSNKAKVGKGAGQVIDDTCIRWFVSFLMGWLYYQDKIKRWQLKLVYPKKCLSLPQLRCNLKGHWTPCSFTKIYDFVTFWRWKKNHC